MFNPGSTYRIQFHKGFNFNDFERVIPYLQKLGISTIYASPVFKATPGSMHGYDGVDPLQINPEIGTLEQLRSISKTLKAAGIGWVQDIVPNHMAFHADNAWLMDALEKGPRSLYADYFDTPLTGDLYKGTIMAPFLGEDLNAAIASGEIQLTYRRQQLMLKYASHLWPVRLGAYQIVIQAAKFSGKEWQQLLAQIDKAEAIVYAEPYSVAVQEVKEQLAAILQDNATQKTFDAALRKINRNKLLLTKLIADQHYRPCNWQESDYQITYRRFFTVNELICLNIQHQPVFSHFHQLIKQLVLEGVFDGLRIDHVDGLYNPAQYLERLRAMCGPETYIVAEKILEQGERLPQNWPIQGTTGYDYLAMVNNLFTNCKASGIFTEFYQAITGNRVPVMEQTEEKKRYMLTQHMAGELNNLLRLLLNSGLIKDKVKPDDLKQVVAELLIKCPVYRYYADTLPLKGHEKDAIKGLLASIRKQHPELGKAVEAIGEIWLKKTEVPEKVLQFYQRCMQFTGPLMAKGVEDTLMYTDNRFIAHNEVGDSPEAFGSSVAEFHRQMEDRQKHWPLAMNGTSTHDTKRGEDVRARLNVLTDLPAEWLQQVRNWQRINRRLKRNTSPDENDEYFIYQTLIGAYPMPGEPDDDFARRLQQYLQKTLREAKQHSNWAKPNEQYEQAAMDFASALLDQSGRFWKSFVRFHREVAGFGLINSLAQVLLKFTCPGVPDVYQGCEHWDLSLVDPDNRRPVNYVLRSCLLDSDVKQLKKHWTNRFNGQIKVWLTHKLAELRREEPLLFSSGKYIPLAIEGKYKDNIIAFARQYSNRWLISIAPLHVAGLCRNQHRPVNRLDWADTRVLLPPQAPEDFKNLLTGVPGNSKGGIKIQEVFKEGPLGLLKAEHQNNGRAAGVLLHITSLPGNYGVGDFGPVARGFADLLHRCHQKYWQLLPLGPVEAQDQYSPYSSWSAMAGNVMLISPELLVQDGLLPPGSLQWSASDLKGENVADYVQAEKIKQQLFEIAWANFKDGKTPHLGQGFEDFCQREAYWLDDFTLYAELKKQHQAKPWFEWPEPFKQRNAEALAAFKAAHEDAMRFAAFLQFLFTRQWQQLKSYCNRLYIQLFGDLPFYVSYDSADVWAHRDIFTLDEDGRMEFVSGVPPDYFNANGQLWGMPVFRWDRLKARGYDWWVQRIRKNMELYDLLRLDHFRAFAAYWAVPAGEQTAINGSWQPGPGAALFRKLQQELGELPFVAEDLGDIDDSVYQLRDDFKLPGMKVLQFAFGDNLPYSPYIPHNFTVNHLVYTGTHDNNTTLGWYRNDIDKATRKRLKRYTGVKLSEDNVHDTLISMAMNSVARICIVPAQDWLGLDERARMNTPASAQGNWQWRLKSLDDFPEKWMRRLTESCGRV